MNFFKRILFGDGSSDQAAEESKQKTFSSGDLTKIVSKKDLDELLKLQVTDLQFCQIRPTQKGNSQIKETM